MSDTLKPRAVPTKIPARIPAWTGKFFHDDTVAGAGFHGLDEGRRKGFTNADMNFNASASSKRYPNGVLINTHWPTTGHGPFHSLRVKGNRQYADLTWGKIRGLRCGPYRIRTITQIIKRAKKDGYTHLELELKDGVDHLTHAQLVALVRQAEQVAKHVGIQIYWKTLSNIGNPLKRIKAVHEGGGITVLLPRDHPHLAKAEWWPVLDYVRDDSSSVVWS